MFLSLEGPILFQGSIIHTQCSAGRKLSLEGYRVELIGKQADEG